MPNGSFEEYSECPTGNELNNGQFERAIGWFSPTSGTPDFYHRCNNDGSGIVGVPNNFWGHQEPFDGDGYAGFGAIAWNIGGEIVGNEYLRIKLISSLKPCMKYHFSMYVSLCNLTSHGVSKLGALFTAENKNINNQFALNSNPQFIHNGSPIIDTANWVKIEGEFIATNFDNYLTIGYFRDTPHLDSAKLQDLEYDSGAFYYVDSISLYEVGAVSEEICDASDLSFPNIITPNNDNSNDHIDATPYFAITDEILILNRWGNVMKVLNKDQPIWDGTTTSGKQCSDGVYFYKFSYQWGDELKQKSGFIHLVR
ncbi:MAG: gliding motility-associated C-terminal domain-containing protein [Brumimicrobium sp.]